MTAKETEQLLQGIASALDVSLNSGRETTMGFIVMAFPLKHKVEGAAETGLLHCVSNTAQEDIPDVLESYVKRMKGIVLDPENHSRRPN